MNLILPLDKQLPSDKNEFNRTFFNKNKELINQNILREAIRGRVSYLLGAQSLLVKTFEGRILKDMGINRFSIVVSYMNEFQNTSYINAWNEDETDRKKKKRSLVRAEMKT